MPQDPFRQVNGPQGPINFPASMNDQQVTQAMQKLYPPKQAAPEAPRGAAYDDPTKSWVGKAGAMVPEFAAPALRLGQKYLVDPFEHMAAKGADMGSQLLQQSVRTGIPGIMPGLGEGHPVVEGIAKGVGETAGGLVADPRNWPLMGSGAVRPVLQKLITRGFAVQMAKGTYDAASQLYKNWDSMTPEQRSELATKGGLSALMTAGLASHLSGSSTGPEAIDRGAELRTQSGKDAVATAPPQKPAPSPAEIQSRALATLTPPELKPKAAVVGEDAMEEARRGAPAQADKPVVNQVPEAERASIKIVKEEQDSLARKIETRAAAKEVAPPEVKTPSVQERVEAIKAQAAPKADPAAELANLRAQRGQEETDLRAMIAERRALNPKVAAAWDAGALPENATRLEIKQAEMKSRQLPITQKQEALEQFVQDHREANAKQLTDLQTENVQLRSKAPVSPEVGREATPPETPKPQPIQAKASEGPREPVRPATQSEVAKGEPRSLRGDLGERPPTPAKSSPVDFQKRMEIYKQRVETAMADPKNKGVPKSELQRRVSEQMKKELGAFGGGGPDDIKARREEKINNWVNQLRDPKTDPASLDTAFKQLQAYGLDHNEIIRRVSGAEGFAVDPHDALAKAERERESLEERLGPNAELDAKADSLIGGLMGSVDKVMGRQGESVSQKPIDEILAETQADVEGRAVGEPDIKSVKSSDVQELDRMFNLRDERGFWRMMPKKKAPPTGPGTGTALDDLTRKMEQSMKAVPPTDSRMKIAERLDKTMTEGWDSVQLSLGKIAAQAVALKDGYMRPPEQTDYHTAIGRFSGSLNRSAWELRQFTKEIKAKLPDERQREAITNWLQADGNDQILAQRATASKGSARAGYERARTLTQQEIGYAKMYEAHFDRRLKEAIQLGILDHGIDNYVPQIWKAKDQQSMSNHFSSLTKSGLVKPDFNSAKKRIFDSYFEGEQAGHKPVSKDIGMLVASWERAFNQAVASRNLIKDLSRGVAEDGRPIVAPSGGVKTVYDPTSNTADPDVSAHLIYPKAAPDETGDYRAVNHPAMTKWNWVGKDTEGNPMYLKGDLRVHPASEYLDANGKKQMTQDYAKKLDNTINRGKWAADHPIQSAILKGQGFFKATLLSASPFHQNQEGIHAIFHGVNPFNPAQIDLANPVMSKLLDRGLVIGNYDPVAAFNEGLTSGMGGAIGKIPGLGRFMQKYSDWLFSDYIPRLKGAMATEAYERNIKRFQGALAQGKITSDQIAEITANQANAAFGELNYITSGRHPQTQAIMRMMFLAPDFLEARTRFVGQALTRFSREQQVALVRGALGMYMGARVLNKILDDDYHWDRPFSVVAGGYEYKIRSLPGDIANLIKDPHSFVMHRLSFVPKVGMEYITGKDEFGRQRDLGEQTWDFIRGVAPIPTQGLFKTGNRDEFGGVLGMIGITRSKYRSEAASMAHEFAIGSMHQDITSHHVSELVEDISRGELDGNKIGKLLTEGKMNPRDLKTAMKLAELPELYRDYYRLPVEQKAKIFAAATPSEQAMIRSFAHKELDTSRLLPEQRAEFMNSFANK